MPKISIVMPVRNNEQYLDESIQSILNQTEKDYEFLIFADRCNEVTLFKLSQYKDSRVKIISNPSIKGITDSLNFLISNASSNIIARQDADDISSLDRLKIFFDENQKTHLTTSNFFIKVDNQLTLQKKSNLHVVNLFNFLFFYNFGAHGQLFFNKQFYNSQFKYCQDYELCSSILRENFKDFYLIEKPIYTYRKHNNSIFNNHRSKQVYFSLLTSQENIRHFLGLNPPLCKVKDMRNFFLEHKKPIHTSETLFLSMTKTILERFKSLFCSSDIEKNAVDETYYKAYNSTFIKSQ